jgi:hypothetical protein
MIIPNPSMGLNFQHLFGILFLDWDILNRFLFFNWLFYNQRGFVKIFGYFECSLFFTGIINPHHKFLVVIKFGL